VKPIALATPILVAVLLTACGQQPATTAPAYSTTATPTAVVTPFDLTTALTYQNEKQTEPNTTGIGMTTKVEPSFTLTIVQSKSGSAQVTLHVVGTNPTYDNTQTMWTRQLPSGSWGLVFDSSLGYARTWTVTLALNGERATHCVAIIGR